jgi:hypothetical protein
VWYGFIALFMLYRQINRPAIRKGRANDEGIFGYGKY